MIKLIRTCFSRFSLFPVLFSQNIFIKKSKSSDFCIRVLNLRETDKIRRKYRNSSHNAAKSAWRKAKFIFYGPHKGHMIWHIEWAILANMASKFNGLAELIQRESSAGLGPLSSSSWKERPKLSILQFVLKNAKNFGVSRRRRQTKALLQEPGRAAR